MILNKIRSHFLTIFVMSVYSFLYIPVIILIIFSFNKSFETYSWDGFTLEWYRKLFYTKEIWISLLNSLVIGTVSVLLSLIFGTLFIWALASKYNYLVNFFYSTIMVPDVVVSAGLLIFFSIFSVPLGYSTLIAGHTLLGLGLAIPIIYTRYNELDYQIVEASMNLGASSWVTFLKIIIPFLKSSLMFAAISVFILSFDDFLISFFCAGSTSQTLSLYIFSIVRSGVSPIINALSSLILIFSAAVLFVVTVLKSRRK